MVTVHVKFRVPLTDPDDPAGTPAQGYFQNLGIRAVPARVPVILTETFTDGVIEWTETEWELVDLSNLDRAIRRNIEPVEGEGIWYRSGRALYADDDLATPQT